MAASKPQFALLAAVGIISSSALAYEVLLMRLFSVIQWHHFAYMIISLALLGYGASGVVLALNIERLMQKFSELIIANMMLFGISAPFCFLLAQQFEFYPAEMLWEPEQWLNLCGMYLLLAIPFFFAANVTGLAFYFYRADVSVVYAADLLGAGIGSVVIIVLLYLLFPQKILSVLIVSAAAAALLAWRYGLADRDVEMGTWFNAPVILGMAVLLAATQLLPLNVSSYKSLNQWLLVPGTKIIDRFSSPLGVINVVSSGITPLRHAPGLSLNATTEPPEQLAVFTDADNMAAINRYDGHPKSVAYLDQTTSALPYRLQALSDVLILGAGAGSDVLLANYHGVKQVDAVELNPQIADLINRKYADFAGHLYDSENISLHIDDARGYLVGTPRVYELINLSLLDAFGGSAAGLYSTSETYLYTEQAISEYLRHVREGGYLALTRWVKIPPRDEVKLLATVVAALKQSGIEQPGRQLAMIRGWQTSTLLIKNGELSADEVRRLKQFCNERSFDLVYFPGIVEEDVNRFNIQQQPYLYQAITDLLGERSAAFIEDYKFNIEPVTDDRPYLFHFFKWRTLPESLALFGRGGSFLLESGYLLMIAALLQAIVASALLIALPLWLSKRKLGISAVSKQYLPVLFYFFCLGLAFLFIEIAFIQKFILILHHPLYSITTVLSTFLLSAGVGSQFSAKVAGMNGKLPVLLPIAALTALCLIFLLSFDTLARILLQTGAFGRYLFSVLLIAPLGFCMGMPYPMGLSRLAETAPAMIPWAWGVNGCASVISAILATLIAMQFGFTVLIVLAIALYVIAGCLALVSCPASISTPNVM